MKVCPICQSRFPESGVFCPHDGTRLVDFHAQAPGDLSQTTLNEVAILTQREHTDAIIDRYHGQLTTNGQKVLTTIFQKEHHPSAHRQSRLQEITTRLGAPLPNSVLAVHSFDLTFDPPYIIESAPQGPSLAKILREHQKLDWKTVLRLICNIGRTLDWAASQDVFHRALTPDLIYVADLDQGRIQIGGWAQAEALLVDSPLNACEANQFAGQPRYLAPETAVNSAHIDARALLYTLSIIAFELITGAPPLLGATDAETIAKHLHEKPPPITQALPDSQIPETLDDILQMMWAKSPNQRFQAIPAAIAALSSLLDADPWTTAPKIERAEKPQFHQSQNAATIAMAALPRLSEVSEPAAEPDEHFNHSQTVLGMPAQDTEEQPEHESTEPSSPQTVFPAVFDPQDDSPKTLLMSGINLADAIQAELAASPPTQSEPEDLAEAPSPEDSTPSPDSESSNEDNPLHPLLMSNLDLSEFSTSSTPFDSEDSEPEVSEPEVSEETHTATARHSSQDVATVERPKTSNKKSNKRSRSKKHSKLDPLPAIQSATHDPVLPAEDTQPLSNTDDETEHRPQQKDIQTQILPAISTDLPKPTPEELLAHIETPTKTSEKEKSDSLKIGVIKSARPAVTNSDIGDDWFGRSAEDAWEDSLANEAVEKARRNERTLFIGIFIVLVLGAAAAYAYFMHTGKAQADADARAQEIARQEAAQAAQPAVDINELRRDFDEAMKARTLLLPRSESALGFLEKMQRHDKNHPEFLEARAIFVQETYSQSRYEEEAGNLRRARDLAGYATQFDPEDQDLKEWAEQLHARLIAEGPTGELFGNPAPAQAPSDEEKPSEQAQDAPTSPATTRQKAPATASKSAAPAQPTTTTRPAASKTPTPEPAAPPNNPAPNNPVDVATLIEQARKAYSRNDLDQAQKLYSQASTLAPNNPTVHAGLGQVYFEQAIHDKALQHQKRAVELRPNQTSYRIQLGMVYYRLNRYQDAINTWNEVLKQDPNNDVAKRYIVLAQGKLG